jgi:hypothetical protein
MSKKIPVKAAKEFADKYKKDQVIITCWSKKDQKTWVTTYGKTEIDCDQACQCGNFFKKNCLNWPESYCVAEPDRVKKLKSKIKELEESLFKYREIDTLNKNAEPNSR